MSGVTGATRALTLTMGPMRPLGSKLGSKFGDCVQAKTNPAVALMCICEPSWLVVRHTTPGYVGKIATLYPSNVIWERIDEG